jgi:hypothetical protein
MLGAVVGRVVPHTGDDGGELHVAVSECGVFSADTADGSVDRVDVYRGLNARYLRALLRLRVMRFFCDNAYCASRTFAEQVANLTGP